MNAIWIAMLMGFIKLAATGQLVKGRSIDQAGPQVQAHFWATHWRP